MRSSLRMTSYLAKTHSPEMALPYFQSAIYFVYKNKDLAKLKFNIGFCLYSIGQKSEALDHLREAQELAEGHFPQASKYIQLCS